MAGVVACLSGTYGKLKSTLTEHIVTMEGVVQEGLVRSERFDAPVKCTTVLVSERLRRTGELRKPAPLLPYQHPTQEDTVELDLLPLTSKKYNIIVPIRDSLPPELEDKQVPAASSVLASSLLLVKCRSVFFSFYSGMFSNIQLLIRFPQPQLPRLGPRWCLQESAVTSSLPSAVDTGRCKLTTTTTTVGDQN